jgi:hypothetical protein
MLSRSRVFYGAIDQHQPASATLGALLDTLPPPAERHADPGKYESGEPLDRVAAEPGSRAATEDGSVRDGSTGATEDGSGHSSGEGEDSDDATSSGPGAECDASSSSASEGHGDKHDGGGAAAGRLRVYLAQQPLTGGAAGDWACLLPHRHLRHALCFAAGKWLAARACFAAFDTFVPCAAALAPLTADAPIPALLAHKHLSSCNLWMSSG